MKSVWPSAMLPWTAPIGTSGITLTDATQVSVCPPSEVALISTDSGRTSAALVGVDRRRSSGIVSVALEDAPSVTSASTTSPASGSGVTDVICRSATSPSPTVAVTSPSVA